MSFIHYLYVGRFERDEHGVRFTRPGPGEPYRPVVARPLSDEEIEAAVRDVTGGDGRLPDEWSAWLDDGYVVCDVYTRNPAEVEFVARLVGQTGSALYDAAGHQDLSIAAWLGIERTPTPVT